MSTPPRPNRFRSLDDQLREARKDTMLFKSALLQKLTDSSKIEQLQYREQQLEDALKKSHDQNRQLAVAVARRFGAESTNEKGETGLLVEFSDSELEQAYRDEPRLEALRFDDPGNRFFLNYSLPERELPPPPPAVPPADTTDTPPASGTEGEEDPLAPESDGAIDPDASTSEPSQPDLPEKPVDPVQ
jgi:hypothetical protein